MLDPDGVGAHSAIQRLRRNRRPNLHMSKVRALGSLGRQGTVGRQMARPAEPVKSLLTCPKCKLEMRPLGVETESTTRELYSFECTKCGALEVRGVKVK